MTVKIDQGIDNEPSGNHPKPSKPVEYVPQEQEVVTAVADLWKSDNRTESLGAAKIHAMIKIQHPDWVLSVNRMKTCLKAANLIPQTREQRQQQQQYADQITSKETPELDIAKLTDNKARLVITKARGKALHAVRDIKMETVLWEEKPLIIVIPFEFIELVNLSQACAYCGRSFQMRGEVERNSNANRGPPGAASCPQAGCEARFCNVRCRGMDVIHGARWHSSEHSKIKKSDWAKFEAFCIENHWMGAYGYGVVLLTCLLQETTSGKGKSAGRNKNPFLRQQFESLATIPQDEEGTTFIQGSMGNTGKLVLEKAEEVWKEAYRLLAKTVARAQELKYTEFLQGVAAYNLNNLDEAIYMLQSHLNHSCEPNVHVTFDDSRLDGIKVTALTDIKANEELKVTYVNPALDVDERQAELLKNWGFICNCPRCKRELKELQAVELDSAGHIKPPPTSMRSRRKSVRFDNPPKASSI